MKRRTLLRLIGLTNLQLFSSRLLGRDLDGPEMVAQFRHSRQDVVLDESGIFGKDHFVVGILTCANLEDTLRSIRNLRNRSRFRCPLYYRSRNKWKASYAKPLIDFWLDRSTIHVRVAAMKQTNRKGEKPSDQDRRYQDLVIGLLNGRPHPSNSPRVITQRRSSNSKNDDNVDQSLKRSRNVVEIKRISSKESELIQLLGLIVGSIYGGYAGSEFKLKNKTKLALIAYLESKLKTPSLWAPIRHPRLFVEIVSNG
jgi:hypothetical protein